MTAEQFELIHKCVEKIGQVRKTLDTVMYGSGELPEKEFKRIRQAYEYLCKANDLL